MSDIIKSMVISQPDASNAVEDELSPTAQRIQIEEKFIKMLSQADLKVTEAKGELTYQQDSKDFLVDKQVNEYLLHPSERHGFIVKQVYPTNMQRVIQEMAEQGYMVHRMGTGMVYFISMKKNALEAIKNKCRVEAEVSVKNTIQRYKSKYDSAIHQRNLVVSQARNALASIRPFEDYLNIIVTDSEQEVE